MVDNWKHLFPKQNRAFETNNGILYNADSFQILKDFPKKTFDLILTDPPYLLDNHGGGNNDFSNRKLVKYNHIGFISNGFHINSTFQSLAPLLKKQHFLIFCSNKQISSLMTFFENQKLSTTLLVCNKKNPIPLANNKYINDIEFIVYVRDKNVFFNNSLHSSLKKKLRTFDTIPKKHKIHPTQKPISLIQQLIQLHSDNNHLILDPFAGSASTAIACESLNRKWIAIEISKHFCNLAIQHFNNFFQQPNLLL